MLQDSDTIRISDVSEAVIHGILAVVSDGIWDWNANTGFVYRNPGWYQMLGYEAHSLGNNVFTWESVIHPDDMDRVMASFDAYLSGAAPTTGSNIAAAVAAAIISGSRIAAASSPATRMGRWPG